MDCVKTSLTLIVPTSTAGGVSYLWNGPDVTGQVTPSVNVTKPGIYTLTVTKTEGCEATASDTAIVIQDITKPTVVIDGGLLTCTKTSVTITPKNVTPAAVTYLWSGPGVPANTTTATYTASQTGTFTITITNAANGCTASDTAIITESKDKPVVVATGGKITCATSSIKLQVIITPTNGTYSYAWTGPANYTSTDKDPAVGTEGTYTVVATDTKNGCTATDTAKVTKDTDLPGASATGGMLTCTTKTITLKGSSTTSGVAYKWTGPGITAANENQQNPVVNKVGTYLLTVTKPGSNCVSTAEAMVDKDTLAPTVTISGGTLTCLTTSLTITATNVTPAGAIYQWTGPDGAITAAANNITATKAGIYAVTVTAPNGCTASDTAKVNENKEKPTLQITKRECAADLKTYTVTGTSNGTVAATGYTVTPSTGGAFTIASVPIAASVQIIATLNATGCKDTVTVTPPDCKCPIIPKPTGKDTVICENAPIPTLSVTASTGVVVDWYSAATGGTKLASGSLTYTPTAAGTFYVEARDAVSGCVSERLAVKLTIKPLPTLTVSVPAACSTTLSTYGFTITSSGSTLTVIPANATVVNNNNGTFIISGIAVGTNAKVTAKLNDCEKVLEVNSPTCNCPTVNPPIVSSKSVCEGDTATTLTATAGTGETVDWYSAATGGTLLASGKLSYKPTSAGTFYAEARKTDGSSCKSTTRTAATLTIKPLPTLTVSVPAACSTTLSTYSFTVASSGILTVVPANATVTNNNNGTFTISGIAVGTNATVTAKLNNCEKTIEVSAPNCQCPTVNPPIGANKTICAGEAIPALTVTVGTGETADWYATATSTVPLTGGTGTLTFTPQATGGTFYVEARKNDGSGCKSTSRIEVKLIIEPTPTLLVSELPACAESRQTYSFVVESNGTLTATPVQAQIQSIGGGKFTVSNVPINTDAVITAKLGKCESKITVKSPNCDCPPPRCVPYTVKKIKAPKTTTPTTGK